MPSSTGSGPKFAAIISQPMLSARSVAQVAALGVHERLLPGLLGARQRADERPLEAAEQVPRLGEGERVAELLGGAQHLLDSVEQPVAVAAEDAQRAEAEQRARRAAAAELERVLERLPPFGDVAARRPEGPERGREAQQQLAVPVRSRARSIAARRFG